MSRIKYLFEKKSDHVLNIYCTAGYPHLNDTMKVMEALQENGADIIELGIPYSDPLADGPVIQESSKKAIGNGMTIKLLFEQLKDLRKKIQVPVLLMGYMNPVLQYGFEKFCREAKTIGIDGLILPDLPEYEFETEYGAIVKQNGLDFVFLITPETSIERIKKLDGLSSGFLYAVSSSSTTGSDKKGVAIKDYLLKLRNLKLQNPILVGFGIKDRASFEEACRYVPGAIIGSAYIRVLDTEKDVNSATKSFLSSIKG